MVVFAALLWTAVSQSVSPQTPPSATGLILGRVVDGTTNRPIGGAIVTLGASSLPSAGPAAGPRALTNSAGQFVFRKLPKGSYRLSVTRAGYADGAYGSRYPGGPSTAIMLEEGQRVGDAMVSLWKFGSIAGTVVDEAGEPMIGVQVRAFERRFAGGRARVLPSRFASTDDRGIYRLRSLVPGDYLVAFVWRETSVPTSVAEILNNPATLNDPKTALLRRERMTATGGFMGASDLAAGGNTLRELDVNAPTPPPGDAAAVFVYPTQFYPGVPTAARARTITLASGQSRENVDFALHPIKTARVSGTVLGPEGPVPNIAVRLTPAGDDMVTELDTSTTITGAGGEFTLIGVPSGAYVLRVLRVPQPDRQNTPPPVMTQVQIGSSTIVSSVSGPGNGPPPPVSDDPTLAASVPVTVSDAGVSDLLVTLRRGPRVTGRYEFDGTAQRPEAAVLTRIMVTLQPANGMPMTLPFGSPPFGHADDTGAFKTYGVAPGKYILHVSDPPGWTLRSAIADGRDISDVPIDLGSTDLNGVVVTFTDRPTTLRGVVRNASGNPDATALVIVFPTDTNGWTEFGVTPRRLRSLRTDRNGSYSFGGLPPGEYYVTALHDDSVPQWQNPQVLEDLSRSATPVRLGEGDARVVDLKSTGGGL